MIFSFAGCGNTAGSAGSAGGEAETAGSAEETALPDLTGKSLMVYCGAGMKDPFTQIAQTFKEETGAEVELSFGNAAQIISQITTSNQGDLFIAGAETELKSLREQNYVTDAADLVKHIPVVAVAEGNPKGIASLADLGRDDVTLVLGDAESTPIGKIADAVLKDNNLAESANILARTATAPEMITALQTGEADAAIVWKENASGKEKLEILDLKEMNAYIKTIPAASLSCTDPEHAEALAAFRDFLGSEEAQNIWKSFGYEIAG
ncbi:MAG: molybdate ABC transporter substrate-binding protein [Firmicutes bacterium]|nr:molybdate ABC transporter substrate-binding protein [Bacillota bacterium]